MVIFETENEGLQVYWQSFLYPGMYEIHDNETS